MENNLLKMIGQLSNLLSTNNPELLDMIKTMSSDKFKNDDDILAYLIKKYPNKEEEIKKEFEPRRKEIREKLELLNSFTSKINAFNL